MKGFDTGANCTNYVERLAAAGYRFGCRYLTAAPPPPPARGDWRHFSHAEAEAMCAAGLVCISISEMGSGDIFSAEHGAIQAAKANEYAHTIGQPEGSAIYFAIDSDRPKTADVIAHFQAIFNAGLPYDIGVYGAGSFCQLLRDELGLVSYAWLANAKAWPGYAAFKGRENILQSLSVTPFAPDAFQIDPCESNADEGFGEWSL